MQWWGYVFACFCRKSAVARKRHAALLCVMQVLLTQQQPFCVENQVCIFLSGGCLSSPVDFLFIFTYISLGFSKCYTANSVAKSNNQKTDYTFCTPVVCSPEIEHICNAVFKTGKNKNHHTK